jgi:FlaA1/EpsC-like NDP-sugar epimerase
VTTAPNGTGAGTGVHAAGDAGSDAAVELKGIRHRAPSSAPRRTTYATGLRRVFVGLRVHGVDWLIEVVAINATVLAVAFVRYRGQIPLRYRLHTGVTAVAMVTVAYTVFHLLFRTYRIVWRFASVRDMAILALTLLFTFVTVGLIEVGLMAGSRPIPLSVLALGGPGSYLILAHLKLVPRTRQALGGNRGRKPLIIFGAGSAGIALVRQLAYERSGYRPVAFLDDDLHKVGRGIAGLPVAGTRLDLARAVKQYGADAVVIAIPSAQSQTIREITHRALDVNARALAVPSITELMAGTELSLRDVGIEDLVGRSEVTVNDDEIRAAFSGRRVLITGAAGSIGSELARQMVHLRPTHIYLLDNNESGLADLRDQLASYGVPVDITVASVTDAPAINAAFAATQPDVVIHAAALKRVDIVENQPREAMEVNVRGTWICAMAAEKAVAQRFILISTDKAVDPVGVLGTTKRIGELMMASLSDSATIFAAVRFGNVLGSRGSVLPKFERQIREGGPLTVTHPDVRRFFMSTGEAVLLVLQSAAFAQPGHTYVLDMGEEMSIAGFARRLASLRGLRVPRDIEVIFTGLRPGERMTEKLIGDAEVKQGTTHPKVMDVAIERDPTIHNWGDLISELTCAGAVPDQAALRERLFEIASGKHRGLYARL